MTGLPHLKLLALTVDVEEWFHAPESPLGSDERAWADLPPSLPLGLGRTLELLDRLGVKATFFVLGWAARRYGGEIRRIADGGHEIASHGWAHRPVDRMSPREFRDDLRASREALSGVTSRPVAGFRAPRWSMPEADWPYEVLAEEGFGYSSSRLAIPGLGVGTLKASRRAGVLEVPALRFASSLLPIPAGGTVALRVLPARWLERARDSRLRAGEPAVFWFHPWELVPEAPRVGGGPLFRWSRYTALDRLPGRLERLIQGGDRTLASAVRVLDLPDHRGPRAGS